MENELQELLALLRHGLLVAVILSAIPLCTGLVLGLVVSVLQAATQIQEQTISFVVKAAGIGAVLYVAAPWLSAELLFFAKQSFVVVSEY